jgi:hypothetical protein
LRLGRCTLLTEMFCLMCNMQVLWLNDNKIGDHGLAALAGALGKGALASLKTLVVELDDEEHPALKAACQARGIELE